MNIYYIMCCVHIYRQNGNFIERLYLCKYHLIFSNKFLMWDSGSDKKVKNRHFCSNKESIFIFVPSYFIPNYENSFFMEKCRGVLLQCSASFKKCYLLTRGGRNLEPNEMNIHEVLWRLTCSYLPPATKLGQGNIFRSVCQEFCPRGVCPIAC